jgi:hypothetical protein
MSLFSKLKNALSSSEPAGKKLEEKTFDKTSDKKLVQTIFDHLVERIPEDFTAEYEIVTSWTKPQQAIYISWCLEGEIGMGGFLQFYQNSYGKFHALVPELLELMGADSFAQVCKKANTLYGREQNNILAHKNGTLTFNKNAVETLFDPLNKEFDSLYKSEDMQATKIRFIRANKNAFLN